MPSIGVAGCKAATIRGCRETWLIPLHDKIPIKQHNGTIAAVYHTNLVGNILHSSIEKVTPIREPGAPGWTRRNTRRQVACLAVLQRNCEDLTASTARVTPPAGDIGYLLTVRRPG